MPASPSRPWACPLRPAAKAVSVSRGEMGRAPLPAEKRRPRRARLLRPASRRWRGSGASPPLPAPRAALLARGSRRNLGVKVARQSGKRFTQAGSRTISVRSACVSSNTRWSSTALRSFQPALARIVSSDTPSTTEGLAATTSSGLILGKSPSEAGTMFAPPALASRTPMNELGPTEYGVVSSS